MYLFIYALSLFFTLSLLIDVRMLNDTDFYSSIPLNIIVKQRLLAYNRQVGVKQSE